MKWPSGSLATTGSETVAPSRLVARDGPEMMGAWFVEGGVTTHINARTPVEAPSDALAVMVYDPLRAGNVPLIIPVDALTPRPGGRPMAPYVNGLPSGSTAVIGT